MCCWRRLKINGLTKAHRCSPSVVFFLCRPVNLSLHVRGRKSFCFTHPIKECATLNIIAPRRPMLVCVTWDGIIEKTKYSPFFDQTSSEDPVSLVSSISHFFLEQNWQYLPWRVYPKWILTLNLFDFNFLCCLCIVQHYLMNQFSYKYL